METQELVNTMKEQGLKDLEVLLKNQLAVAYDPAIEMVAGKIKETIPGTFDDSIVDMVVNAIKPLLKDALMEQISKVSA